MIREKFKPRVNSTSQKYGKGKYGEDVEVGLTTNGTDTSYLPAITRDELKELKREINRYLRSTKNKVK